MKTSQENFPPPPSKLPRDRVYYKSASRIAFHASLLALCNKLFPIPFYHHENFLLFKSLKNFPPPTSQYGNNTWELNL
jgi:hypothetical protein